MSLNFVIAITAMELILPSAVEAVVVDACWYEFSHYERLSLIRVSCCCRAGVLRFRTSYVLGRPEPAAISGNTSELPHFLVYSGSVNFIFCVNYFTIYFCILSLNVILTIHILSWITSWISFLLFLGCSRPGYLPRHCKVPNNLTRLLVCL